MTIHALPLRTATDAEGTKGEQAERILTLAIENMHCGGCLKSVERAALAVPGVEHARANLAAKRVSVALADGAAADEVALIEALRRAGFAAAPIEAVKQDADTARQSYLLRRVAVAGLRRHEHHAALGVGVVRPRRRHGP